LAIRDFGTLPLQKRKQRHTANSQRMIDENMEDRDDAYKESIVQKIQVEDWKIHERFAYLD